MPNSPTEQQQATCLSQPEQVVILGAALNGDRVLQVYDSLRQQQIEQRLCRLGLFSRDDDWHLRLTVTGRARAGPLVTNYRQGRREAW